MEQHYLDIIHVCLNEIQMMRQLLDKKVADDFCSRLLGIYVMMRVDDITKIWSHQIPKQDIERKLAEDVKSQYNDGLRALRDKLGAHCQNTDDNDELFGSVKLFKSFDYAKTACLIDALIEAESKIEGAPIYVAGFNEAEDINAASDILRNLYSDDQAFITNASLDIFGINKGGLMTTTKSQAKGQLLRSIELMEEVVHKFTDYPFSDANAIRLFKRFYVCIVYNYHDNLITRKDITVNAAQYEEGFDILFKNLITKNDKADIVTTFDDFEKIYQIEPVIRKYRDVRNKACAHFDESSDIEKINKELDSINIGEIKETYKQMLRLFNYICNNVFCLKMLALSPRTPIYNAQFESIENNDNFYGEVQVSDFPVEMNSVEILRSVRRQDERYDEACETLRKKLMAQDDNTYNEMISAISQRLKEPSATDEEISVIIQALSQAQRGFPERLQRSLIDLMSDDYIFRLHSGHLLWIISKICREDDNIDIRGFLESIIIQNKPIPTALSLLALLHLACEKKRSVFPDNNIAHVVDADLIRFCSSITKPTERLLVMMVLGQHWFWDQEYAYYRSYEKHYTEFLSSEVKNALDQYLNYIRLDDTDEIDLCNRYIESNHYLLTLYRLSFYEKARKQSPNLFLEAWKYNCFIRTKEYLYEGFGVALMCELEGNVTIAKDVFESLLEINPINRDAIDSLKNFYDRNPGLQMKIK